MSVYPRIKNYLLGKCIDLDKLAVRIGRSPETFKKVLDGESPLDDERNLTADELREICIITETNADKLLGCQ